MFLTPLLFNPYAALPFEPAKAQLVRYASLLICILAIAQGSGMGRPGVLAELRTILSGRAALSLAIVATIALFAVSVALSTALSADVRQSLWGIGDGHGAVTTLSTLVLGLICSFVVRTYAQLHRLGLALAYATAAVVAYGFVQFLGLDPLPWITDSVSPVHSTLGRSNYLGAYIAVVLPLFLYLWGRAEARPWVAFLVAASVACLFLTQARAGWLAAVLACTLFTATLAVRRRSGKVVALSAAILILGVALYTPLSHVQVREWQPVNPTPQAHASSKTVAQVAPANGEFSAARQSSIQRRFVIWRASLRLMEGHWLLGYGPERFAIVFNTVYEPGSLYDGSDIIVDDPHNLFVDQLFSSGVVGLFAYLGVLASFFVALWSELWQTEDRDRQAMVAAVMASASAFLIQAQLNPDVIALGLVFWVLVGVTLALPRLGDSQTQAIELASPVQTVGRVGLQRSPGKR